MGVSPNANKIIVGKKYSGQPPQSYSRQNEGALMSTGVEAGGFESVPLN